MEGISVIFCCIFGFTAIMLVPFIVCDLYFAYGNDLCLIAPITNYGIGFDLKTWLLVEGYGNLAVVALLFLVALIGLCSAGAAAGLLIFSLCLLGLYSAFRLAWLIVGAIMFWGQLNGSCGQSLNDYMWALLIINFVGTFCNIIGGNKARATNENGGAFSGGLELN